MSGISGDTGYLFGWLQSALLYLHMYCYLFKSCDKHYYQFYKYTFSYHIYSMPLTRAAFQKRVHLHYDPSHICNFSLPVWTSLNSVDGHFLSYSCHMAVQRTWLFSSLFYRPSHHSIQILEKENWTRYSKSQQFKDALLASQASTCLKAFCHSGRHCLDPNSGAAVNSFSAKQGHVTFPLPTWD